MHSMKTIYIVRHPKTTTPDGVCYGRSNVTPNKQSLIEAEQKVKAKLEGACIDICYTSPLQRCTLLAAHLAGHSKIISDDSLQEIDFGSWEMTPWDEIPPQEQALWGKDFIRCKVHGGENFLDLQQRVVAFWLKLVSSTEQTALVITHAGLIRALLNHLLDTNPEKIFAIEVDYADVIRITWSNENYYKIKFL